jgi:sulfotransferase family protein
VGVNPYLFVVGCPRSGTTLLRRLLDAHPRIAITRETHWIPKFAQRGGGHATPELVAALCGHPRFAKLGLSRTEVEQLTAGSPSYGTFVAALFDRYGEKAGKPLVGDKTPGYARTIPLLHELFPQARFVHLVRDGRDVCLSALSWERKRASFERRFTTWADSPVATCALWWRRHVLLGRRAGRELPPGLYYELRYEALVADPEAELRALCAFLDVDYSETMLRYYEERTRHEPGLSAKKAWLPPTPGLRDWRTQMATDHVIEFESAAGDALEELGYERAQPAIDSERAAATAVVSRAFGSRRGGKV